jgi:phosphate/sulfate permease
MIGQVEEDIKEAESFGMQAPESRKMAELSKSALQREDYAKAEERASSAVAAFMIESQGLETMKFIYANWHFIIAASALIAGTCYIAYRKSLKGRLRKRIGLLAAEEKATRKLMEKAQEGMYTEKTLSKPEYHKLMAEHETRLAKIRKREAELNRRLIRLEKRSVALSNFRKQESSLRSEIQGLQKKYYEQGSVSKSAYQKTVDELREELAESIKNIDVIISRRKGQAGFLILGILLILCVAFASFAVGQADDKQAASIAMEKAQGWIKEMEQTGFPAIRANDTLNEARLLFDKGYYQAAESLANDVEGIKERAVSISGRIDGVEASLYQSHSKGINVSQPQALFDAALDAFRQEDYESAESLLSQASAKLEELESDYSMKMVAEGKGLEGLMKRIQDNILLILLAAVVLASAGIAGAKIRRKRKIRGRMRRLEAKAEKLNSMMKELQTKYFEKGSVSESEYKSLMERYRKRLTAAKGKKLALEEMLSKKQKKTDSGKKVTQD